MQRSEARFASERLVHRRSGFTLIELSIVLVIIGLLVGGILVGQDLIRAAGAHAQISQIEKYNSAVNTFYGKYGAMPGDINANTASQFGFTPRGTTLSCGLSGDNCGGSICPGQGDGNGLLELCHGSNGSLPGLWPLGGEGGMLWSDLTYANGMNLNLIDGSFSTLAKSSMPFAFYFNLGGTYVTDPGAYFPQARIGRGNFIMAFSAPLDDLLGGGGHTSNYFSISKVVDAGPDIGVDMGLTVREAYEIDRKWTMVCLNLAEWLLSRQITRAWMVQASAFGPTAAAFPAGWEVRAIIPVSP